MILQKYKCKICGKPFESLGNDFYPDDMIIHAEKHLENKEKPKDTFVEES